MPPRRDHLGQLRTIPSTQGDRELLRTRHAVNSFWSSINQKELTTHTNQIRGDTLLGGNRVLAGTSARTLAGDDRPLDKELATPYAPWLRTIQGAGKALDANRACPTQGLGKLDIGWALGEPQLGIGLLTRDVRTGVFGLLVQVNECGELHRVSPPSFRLPRSGGELSGVCHHADPRQRPVGPAVDQSCISSSGWRAAWAGGHRDNTKAADPGCRVPRPGGGLV